MFPDYVLGYILDILSKTSIYPFLTDCRTIQLGPQYLHVHHIHCVTKFFFLIHHLHNQCQIPIFSVFLLNDFCYFCLIAPYIQVMKKYLIHHICCILFLWLSPIFQETQMVYSCQSHMSMTMWPCVCS